MSKCDQLAFRDLIFYIFTCYDDGGVLMVVVMVRYDNFRAFKSKCDQVAFRGLIFDIFIVMISALKKDI